MDKKSLKVKIFLNFYGTYIKLQNVAGNTSTETMSGGLMALKAINKINSRLKFLHRKNKFSTPMHSVLSTARQSDNYFEKRV